MAKLIHLLLLCFSLQLMAQEAATTETTATESLEDPTGLSLLPDLPAKNQNPLFDNRLRIDYEERNYHGVFPQTRFGFDYFGET